MSLPDSNPDWPLFALRLTSGDLELRPLCEIDLSAVAAVLPDDSEHDPRSPLWDHLDPAANRRRLLYQNYWRDVATWSPENWHLTLHVSDPGGFVGIQALEAENFAQLRTVDSFSWVVPSSRGRGVGRAMRTAVLSLAFDHLGAQFAVTSARENNVSSLAVSRRLGYVDNGVSRTLSPSGPATLHHLRLNRDQWRGTGASSTVGVTGLENCRHFFLAP